MKENEKKDLTKVIEKWTPFFIIICSFLGIVLGSFLAYYFLGEFPYGVLAGGLVATIILLIIQAIKHKVKKDNIPEADERIVRNIFRFWAYTSHTFIAMLFIAITVITLLGKDSVSTLYLWIFFFAYVWVVGIGAPIIKRR